MQPGETEIAAVQDIEGARLDGQKVHDVHVVDGSRGDMDPAGDVPAQVQKRVGLYGRFGFAEPCPREKRKAQIDGG